MNLKDQEWEPNPTPLSLLRRIQAAANTSVSMQDIANLRTTLLAPPFHGAIPHEVRGVVWLLLLRLRIQDLLLEDANVFAQMARHAVRNDSSKDQIEKDVERTRPGLSRFKQPAVRRALLRLLCLFCARHKVAYVQGFNELLAPFVVLADTGGNPRIVYALFSNFVTRFAPWMLETSECHVFDVLKRMFKYFGRLLLYHDPELYWLLERHMMTPDLYATSWFVTLFARNFTVESVLALWDLLLLEDNPLGITFFGVALLCSKRVQLLTVDESRIPETLMMLTARSQDEVRKLWKIGSFVRVRTPPSFQRLMADRLLADSPGQPARIALSAARAMQASVCLQTTPGDLVSGKSQYFTWDCRTEEEYNSGHLAQAAYLPLHALREANGKITFETSDAAREELQMVVEMCEPLKESSHICLLGSGIREEDNQDVNMLALYLTRIGIPYVSTLRGGFREVLAMVSSNERPNYVELVDYDPKQHQQARHVRVSLRMYREQQARKCLLVGQSAKNSYAKARAGTTPHKFTSDESPHPGTQAISSFLGKTDNEVSKALKKALGGVRLDHSLSSFKTSTSQHGHRSEAMSLNPSLSSSGPFIPLSSYSAISPASCVTTSVADNGNNSPLGECSSGAMVFEKVSRDDIPDRASCFWQSDLSSRGVCGRLVEGTNSNSCPRNEISSFVNNLNDIQSPHIARAGFGVQIDSSYVPVEVLSPKKSKGGAGGLFSEEKSQWDRDAKPGWLGKISHKYLLRDIPNGFTVNVLDSHVMAGLRLFPCKACKAESDCNVGLFGGGNDLKRQFVGVSAHYFLLLSPRMKRSHLLQVNLICYLQNVSRITFKRSRPELVTFEILNNEEVLNESVICFMPNGLKECVSLINDFVRAD